MSKKDLIGAAFLFALILASAYFRDKKNYLEMKTVPVNFKFKELMADKVVSLKCSLASENSSFSQPSTSNFKDQQYMTRLVFNCPKLTYPLVVLASDLVKGNELSVEIDYLEKANCALVLRGALLYEFPIYRELRGDENKSFKRKWDEFFMSKEFIRGDCQPVEVK